MYGGKEIRQGLKEEYGNRHQWIKIMWDWLKAKKQVSTKDQTGSVSFDIQAVKPGCTLD